MQNDTIRDKSINGAGTKGRLTLMTSQFSRGTDIVIRDRIVKENGGLALMMAYLPKSNSQFQQFKGRTGRQGNNGSIDIFFNNTQFTKIVHEANMPIDIIPQKNELIEYSLSQYWKYCDQLQMGGKLSELKYAEQKHKKTIKFFSQMDRSDKQG